MTTPRSRSARLLSACVSAACVAGAAAATAAALAAASGVTPLGGNSYDTEFIDGGLYALSWLSLVGLAVAAWWAAVPAVLGLVGVVAVTTAGMAVTVRRYAESGWGSGLEYLGFVVPVGLLLVGSAALAVVVAVRRGRSGGRAAGAAHSVAAGPA